MVMNQQTNTINKNQTNELVLEQDSLKGAMEDFKASLLITSLLINLAVLTTWITFKYYGLL